MSKPRVDVETTIPSFYDDARTTPEIVARRTWTRRWWAGAADQYELLTSTAVIAELKRGPAKLPVDWLELIAGLPLLDITSGVTDIVEKYLQHRLMPTGTGGDILHLALVSHHKCNYLVTWNCKHLANANKFQHIHQVNTRLGL